MTNEMPKTVGGDNIQITIGDDASSVAVGKNVQQMIGMQTPVQVTEADIAAVRNIFAELKHQIDAQSLLEKSSAMERVNVTVAQPGLKSSLAARNPNS